MARASICPVCKKILGPAQAIYTIEEQDYHPECYERREAESAESERGPDGARPATEWCAGGIGMG